VTDKNSQEEVEDTKRVITTTQLSTEKGQNDKQRCTNVATYKWKVHNGKIEIIYSYRKVSYLTCILLFCRELH
jgi:hypothetical protein